jgi:hypothetical protein
MAVKMPKQPFPGGALGPGWHDYIAQIEKNSETLDSLDTRATALEENEASISRSDLASGFGRILISETKTEITDNSEVPYVGSSALAWEPLPTDGLDFYTADLEATTDSSRFRVTAQMSMGQRFGSGDPRGFWVAFQNENVIKTCPIIWYYVGSDGSFAYGAATGAASFWCDPGRIVIRGYRQTSLAAYLNAYNTTGSKVLGDAFSSHVTIEEWAVI